MYVDTNFGGRDNSTFYAICNENDNPSLNVIVWASSMSTKNPDDSETFLLENIRNFRQETRSSHIPMIICYETVSNYHGHSASKLIRENSYQKEFKLVFFVYEPNWVGTEREREGVNVFGSRKNQFVLTFITSIKQKCLRVSKSVGNYGNGILSELHNFSHELSIFRGKDLYSIMKNRKEREKFNSGKTIINGEYIRDDRAFTIIAIVYLKQLFHYDQSCKSQRIFINAQVGKDVFGHN